MQSGALFFGPRVTAQFAIGPKRITQASVGQFEKKIMMVLSLAEKASASNVVEADLG